MSKSHVTAAGDGELIDAGRRSHRLASVSPARPVRDAASSAEQWMAPTERMPATALTAGAWPSIAGCPYIAKNQIALGMLPLN